MLAFFRLSPGDRGTVVRAVVAAPIVRWQLERHSLRRVVESLENRARQPASSIEAAIRVAELAEKTIARLPGTHTCLVRSLVVWWLVGGEASAEIRFGVAPPEDGEVPRFHAWVEFAGEPINDDPDVAKQFLPLTAPAPDPDQFD